MINEYELLINFIRSDYEEFANSGDFDAIASAAVETTSRPVKTYYSLQLIGDRVGEILSDPAKGLQARRLFAASLIGAIEAKVDGWQELQIAQQALAVGQLSLWQPDRQAVIAALSANWPEDIRNAVLSLGVESVPVWQVHGLSQAPTADELRDAWNSPETARRRGVVQDALIAILDQVNYTTTAAQVVTLVETTLSGKGLD